MTCLLCEADAVADCLCVPCGAAVWAAKLWLDKPFIARQHWEIAKAETALGWGVGWEDKNAALLEIQGPAHAKAFLTRLQSAKEARGVS